jgi:hypothetical protein
VIPFYGCDDDLRPLSPSRVERRAQIAERMQHTAKASEGNLPLVQRRQILDVQHVADALATGQTIEHTAAWSRWDWIRWAAFWFLVAGPLLFICLLAWA